MSAHVAMVTGIAGQDGSYMAQWLLGKGYEVVGVGQSIGSVAPRPGLRAIACDVTDGQRMAQLVDAYRPSEIYNCAAMSSGAGMYDDPARIGMINGLAVTHLLEAIRRVDPRIRLCQASSSEMFGQPLSSPQSEATEFRPRSPYGAAKVYAHTMLRIYRERYGMHLCSAILFNHESPLRRLEFVTRKVTHAAAAIKLGRSSQLQLGDLDACRDWGYAGDVVRAMWLMLQNTTPNDYVVATGQVHSVRELCEIAFSHLGLDYREFVRESAEHARGSEQVQLVGDPSRARADLGWEPQVAFADMIRSMVDSDMKLLSHRKETGPK